MTCQDTYTAETDCYDFTRDGKSYSVNAELECNIDYTYEPGDYDTPTFCEVCITDSNFVRLEVYGYEEGEDEEGGIKGFEMTEEELKGLRDYLEEKAQKEYQFMPY